MTFETIAVWVAVALYAAASVSAMFGVVFGRAWWLSAGIYVGLSAFAVHTAAIIARLIVSGRLPVAGDYENAVAGSWAIMLGAALLLLFSDRSWRVVAAFVLPLVLVIVGFGATSPVAITPLAPAYRSGWLAVHVTFAWLTYAAYTCAASISVLVLLRSSGSRRLASLQARLPSAAAAEELTLRLVGIGFLMNAIMIASGAIWAYRLWGAYWSWDPVETWSLITWLAYGLYLHLKLTMGWSGPRLAWIAVLALFGILMSFWGVQFVPSSYHLFRDIGGTFVPLNRP